MELVTPQLGLMFWTSISLTFLCFILYCLYNVTQNKILNLTEKFYWTLIIIGLPLVGSFAYFIMIKKRI